jgi:hypothetical protein
MDRYSLAKYGQKPWNPMSLISCNLVSSSMLLKMSEVNPGELLVYTVPFLDFLALLLAPLDRGVLSLVVVFCARWIPFFRRTCCNAFGKC